MKTTVYNSDYLSLEYFQKYQLLIRHWKKTSFYLSDSDFQTEMLQVKKYILEYLPTYLLGDTHNFLYVIRPDMQIWLDQEFYARLSEWGVLKMAFVTSKDTYANMSVEQSIEESNKSYMIQWFSTEYEAIEWLIGIGTTLQV